MSSISLTVHGAIIGGASEEAPKGTLVIDPQEVYDGGYPNADEIRLRMRTGASGQSGLIRAWADAFIKHCVDKKKMQPFRVGWYLGDTTQNIAFLEKGAIDIAGTYNEAAELQALASGAAKQRVYGFRVRPLPSSWPGPRDNNPAGLASTDDVVVMFNKIVTQGNLDAATPPKRRPPVRFLSRYDKSATNIKKSELFIKIGQVPWAFAYSTWYHQYPRFPFQSLEAAAKLSEYMIIDRGTWVAVDKKITSQLEIYKAGEDVPTDPLLTPANVLLGSKVHPANAAISLEFMDWVAKNDGGQGVVENFEHNGEILYTKAPKS